MKPDYCLVLVDETPNYIYKPQCEPYILSIKQTYVYDRNSVTYCCESRPSYWLIPVYTYIVFHPNTPNDVKEQLEAEYCLDNQVDSCYMHCFIVDVIARNNDSHKRYPNNGDDISLDEAVEYFHGNWEL